MLTSVTGINWGDEGKGKITDVLAKDADVVIYKGNPLTDLQYTTKYTLINGQIVYQAE